MTPHLAEEHSLGTYFRPKRAAHSCAHIKMKVNQEPPPPGLDHLTHRPVIIPVPGETHI